MSCLREAAEAKTDDENAWTKGWTILAHILFLLLGPFSSLHDTLCAFRIIYR
jgi:hypothetical protein